MNRAARAHRAWRTLPGRVGAVGGWRRFVLSFGLGAAAAAALPPVHAIPLLALSFTGLIWQLDAARSHRTAFALGWWFGVGFFVAGLYWIAHAMLIEPARFGWMIPFAVGGLAAGMALFPALAALLARLSRTSGPGRLLVFAAAWTATEWLRGEVLTGFPWNPLASVWMVSVPMLQMTAVTGVFGLSLVTAFAAVSPAGLHDAGRRWAPGAAALLLLAVWVGGSVRLAGAETGAVPGVTLRIVQPNIDQRRKGQEDLRAAQIARQAALSVRPRAAGRRITHVVWPETAVPYLLARAPDLRRALARIVPPGGLVIAGALRATPASAQPFRVWNSLQAIDDAGRIVASYDKSRLVPFGEYVPLRSILGMAKLTVGDTDFSAGPGPRTLRLAGLPPVSPLICYEAIFPGKVVDPGDRPGWLLNVTNDAWFGASSGPYQHFASARIRAIEEGVPLVRAANSGISGVVDAYGRITARLGLGVEGVLDSALPRALPEPPPFAAWGHVPLAILLALTAAAGLAAGRRAALYPPARC